MKTYVPRNWMSLDRVCGILMAAVLIAGCSKPTDAIGKRPGASPRGDASDGQVNADAETGATVEGDYQNDEPAENGAESSGSYATESDPVVAAEEDGSYSDGGPAWSDGDGDAPESYAADEERSYAAPPSEGAPYGQDETGSEYNYADESSGDSPGNLHSAEEESAQGYAPYSMPESTESYADESSESGDDPDGSTRPSIARRERSFQAAPSVEDFPGDAAPGESAPSEAAIADETGQGNDTIGSLDHVVASGADMTEAPTAAAEEPVPDEGPADATQNESLPREPENFERYRIFYATDRNAAGGESLSRSDLALSYLPALACLGVTLAIAFWGRGGTDKSTRSTTGSRPSRPTGGRPRQPLKGPRSAKPRTNSRRGFARGFPLVFVGLAATAALAVWRPTLHAPQKVSQFVNQDMRRYGRERGSMEYGFCEVSIPPEHKIGELDSPSIFKLQFREDPNKHVVLLDTQPQEPEQFFAEVRNKVDSSFDKSALVFVHGYNVDFAGAARRTAQMAHDLEFDGAAILYSWPSQGDIWGYTTDETNVDWTVPHLQELLERVVQDSGAENIILVAHSMGNRALTDALRSLQLSESEKAKLTEVILAAPDIDADIFRRDIVPALVNKVERVTLYASSSDEALRLSKQVHGYPRAGDSGGNLVIVPGLETIDVTRADTSWLGHSYYGSNRWVLEDLWYLVRKSLPADERPRLQPRMIDGHVYWEFVPSDEELTTSRRGQME